MGLIGSVVEGLKSVGESIGHAVKGEWKEAGKDFAKAGLEAAGIAGSVLAGPQMEALQEKIEKGLDAGLLKEKGAPGGAGDVPPPKGGDSGGASAKIASQGGANLQGLSGDELEEVLSQAGGKFGDELGDFLSGSNLMSQLTGSAGNVGNKILSSVL